MVWWGTRENQETQRRQEQLLWGSVGERLNTTHTHTSPLTEHPAPTHALLLSPELRLGHTGSPTPQGAVTLLCSPRPWAVRQRRGPMSWGRCIPSPPACPRGSSGGPAASPTLLARPEEAVLGGGRAILEGVSFCPCRSWQGRRGKVPGQGSSKRDWEVKAG